MTALTDPDHGLTAHARRFSHLDAVAAVADALPHGAAIAEVERLTDRVLEHPAFVSLPTGGEQATSQAVGQRVVGGPGIRSPLSGVHQMAGGQLYSTRDVTEAERTILDHATTRTTTVPAAGSTVAGAAPVGPRRGVAVPLDVVDRAVSVVEAAQGFALSAEQRQVLERVVTSSRPVQAVEGPPGSGKTTLMRAARVAWEAAGHTVAGAATAAVAAQNLAAESGISSRTVAQWLWRIDNGPGLAGVDVLVLDEANLTSDRDRAALYRAAATSGTQIVEVGDPHQLRGVGEGSMFGYLHTLLDGPRFSENRRQRRTDERAALAAFREGHHADALHTYQRIGGLVATETADEAIAAMVSTWLRAREGAPDPHTLTAGLVMLAATNEQVARINDAVQAVRAARGELGESATYQLAAGRHATFRVGDLVMVRRNDRTEQAVTGAPVLNGYRGVVTAITPNGVEVAWHANEAAPATQPTTQTAEPADGLLRAVLSPGFVAQGGLELGYALTAHKAEGLTVNGGWVRPDGTRNEGTVLVYGPDMDNPGLYVSLSRDKGQAILFAARTELEGDRENLLYGPPASEQALTDRVVAALAEQANATATNANDRPVLVDLGHAPADPAENSGAGTSTEAPAARHEEPVPGPERTEPLSATHHDPARQPGHQPGHGRVHEADREADHEVAREPVGVRVSDEQRRQWRDLVERSVAARVADDRDAYRALLAQRRALAAELGPDRVEVLRQESHERGRRAGQRMIERQTDLQERIERLKWTVQWSGRPHARLTDTKLNQAIRDADRRAAAEHAAASKARRDLAAREPAVTAGQGPRVTELDTRLHQLRVNAERQGTAEALEQRWHQAVKQAGDAAEQAALKEYDAERTSRWQPGKRERLQTEAAALRAVVDKATKEADELARHAAEIQQQLGGPGLWRNACKLAEQAEASYERDRHQAAAADRHDLTRLERTAATHDTHATQARALHTELTAEQHLRETMPEPQRAFEHQLRAEAIHHQPDHASSLLQPDRSLQPDLPADLHPDPGLHHGRHDVERYQPHEVHQEVHRDLDRGPGLGL